ncbi:PhoH family protein [Desulfurispirillum indicum]|uniref:PhoH-like protein n=1 Tax=Desulfurispirillum indicum (strain ATCC BAA-1389 / DSM 22839 / S5) TaxID=653733 RepID=E6W1K3_DESIS|nr:PhoH family protein [Desulfurispirillum indicum]ADU66552.1 PhoH family protein [Desulfurispirillum indicum S5]UCZ55873.1 PhoH family protein [Desulfurispirillum indicum]
MHTQEIELDVDTLAQVMGIGDGNLREVERVCDVTISGSGNRLLVRGGSDRQVEQAVELLQQVNQRVRHGETFVPREIPSFRSDADGDVVRAGRKFVRPRNASQQSYVRNLQERELTFGIGPAGTGKTYMAVACAVERLQRGVVDRIIITRPAVEAGEKLGFLPGDLEEKVDPYLRPIYDALHDFLGVEKVEKLMEKKTIEVAPIAFMRGRTLSSAFILLDEAQNATPSQMKMFLTRLGNGSTMAINGDPTQTDLPAGVSQGLQQAIDILRHIPEVGMTFFSNADVVRHPLVSAIVQAYEHYESGNKQ